MPFTLSHAVLAPALSRLSHNKLPIAALAIGCMLPDLYRLFVTDAGQISHRWSGQIYPNLIIGLGFCGFWYALYRPMLYQLLDLSDPLKIYDFSSILSFIFSVVIALLIGNASHILWDGLTHVDFRTLILHDFLSQNIQIFNFNYPLHFILQIFSSLIALPILIILLTRYCQQHRRLAISSQAIKISIISILSVAVLAAGYWTYLYFNSIGIHQLKLEPYYYIGRGFNEFSQIFLLSSALALSILGLLQQFFRFK